MLVCMPYVSYLYVKSGSQTIKGEDDEVTQIECEIRQEVCECTLETRQNINIHIYGVHMRFSLICIVTIISQSGGISNSKIV